MSSRVDPDFVSAVMELLQSMLRALILTTAGICLLWYLAAAMTDWGEGNLQNIFLVSLSVLLLAALALHLVPRRLLVAQVSWLVGLTAAVGLAMYLFQQPEVAFFLALLPLIATVTVGWQAGVLAEGLVVVVAWSLSGSHPYLYGFLGLPLSPSQGFGVIAGGAITGMLGWSATRSLLMVTQWSLANYERTRQQVLEAREQRLELKQTQEDLLLANRELARLSDRLEAMYQVAEEARRAKEEFVANVSHELRTPLNMIIGFSELIAQSPEVYGDHLPPALLADIDAIQRNSRHLAKLVDDVLDLSQVEGGHMTLSKEWASLSEIVEGAVAVIRGFFESKGLYLETEIASDIPAVYCDSTRIRQVVLNLLSNAGRFTEQGGVQVEAWRDDGNVVISVTDTGPGIGPEDRERIFEPFQQLDSSLRRRHGGSGLGLSISRRFVEMHEGKVWLESDLGQGTTIYFSLPLDMPSPAAPACIDDAKRWFNPYEEYEYRIRTRPSRAPALTVVPRLVLLEKGGTLRGLLGRYLQDVEIVSVADVEEAIGTLSRSPAHALIVNAHPFENTYSLASRLGNLPYGIPVVTCWVPGKDEVAKQLGVVRYLVKPVTRDMLLSTVEGLGSSVKDVLLVDDESEVLRLFSRMLSSARHKYRVLRAMSGQRALRLLRERQPDVMLLDLVMPGMDGFQVLQEKSQDARIQRIPVVVITSRDPYGRPIVSDTLGVTRGGGLSVGDLLGCIQAISEIPYASVQSDGRGRPERPDA
jgi:signal transduction histidine kinase/CheY-like chemotaxis protein